MGQSPAYEEPRQLESPGPDVSSESAIEIVSSPNVMLPVPMLSSLSPFFGEVVAQSRAWSLNAVCSRSAANASTELDHHGHGPQNQDPQLKWRSLSGHQSKASDVTVTGRLAKTMATLVAAADF